MHLCSTGVRSILIVNGSTYGTFVFVITEVGPGSPSPSPFRSFRSWTIRRSWRARLGMRPALMLRSYSRRACHLKGFV